MDKMQVILYGAASYLGLKSLLSLMADYRQSYKRKLAKELMANRQTPAASPPTDGPKPAAPKAQAR